MMGKKGLVNQILIPIFIAIVTAFSSVIIQDCNNAVAAVAYSIEGPITFFRPTSHLLPEIQINKTNTTQLFGYKVHLWNSGSLPIENMQVACRFDTNNKNFKVLTFTHEMVPAFLFNNFKKLIENSYSVINEYKVFNQGDEILINFLTNGNCPLIVVPHSKGLKRHKTCLNKEQLLFRKRMWVAIPTLIVIILYAFLTLSFQYIKIKAELIRTKNELVSARDVVSMMQNINKVEEFLNAIKETLEEIDRQKISEIENFKDQFRAKKMKKGYLQDLLHKFFNQ